MVAKSAQSGNFRMTLVVTASALNVRLLENIAQKAPSRKKHAVLTSFAMAKRDKIAQSNQQKLLLKRHLVKMQ